MATVRCSNARGTRSSRWRGALGTRACRPGPIWPTSVMRRCLASYRWTNGHALSPVDWFDVSPGQADPYFSVFVRQPVPAVGFLPEHLELVVDMRNLLAQGYIPVLARDGQTLYLVQAARSVRGGVAFSF